jgi:hypothetical protein
MKRGRLRRCAKVAGGLIVFLAAAFLIYFPGRQSLYAVTLATGLGVGGLQENVDRIEEKAANGETFTDSDKAFLKDLYTCFAKGGRLTVVLRQSGQLMGHYLSKSGEDLRLEPRIFLGSATVREQMVRLREEIGSDLQNGSTVREEYTSLRFHMGDPEFYESAVGLYYGRLIVRPRVQADGRVELRWRAEVPWEWPSYEYLRTRYNDPHAESFPLPNARSLLQGPEYCLYIDNGLGEYLVRLSLAEPFLAYSEWEEEMMVPKP